MLVQMEIDHVQTRRILACLGDGSRFRVMSELVRGERCVTELAALVGLSQSCTTRHLQVLEREGLVTSLRCGKRVIFTASESPRIVKLLDWALFDTTENGLPRDRDLPASAPPRTEALVRVRGSATTLLEPATAAASGNRLDLSNKDVSTPGDDSSGSTSRGGPGSVDEPKDPKPFVVRLRDNEIEDYLL